MEANYYQILEIPPDASEKDIKRAYHRLARERHPDKATSPEQAQRLQEEFALVSTAYNVLKDKEKRAEYDLKLKKDQNRRGAVSGGGGERVTMPGGGGGGGGGGATTTKVKSVSVRERAAIAQRAFAKGMQLFNACDYARAIDFFEAAVQNNEDEAAYHSKLGVSLMRCRKGFNKAATAIQRAIELDPYNVEHRLALGEAYELVGSSSLALKTYQEILKWDGSNVKAHERIAALGGNNNTILGKVLKFLKRQ